MNSCILMAEIYDNPQLRHTPDGLEVTEMIVHVAGMRSDDPSHPLKVVSWGNLAKEIHQSYHEGDRVIMEGRLGMNTFDNPQGFKEKRAELTVQRIYPLNTVPASTTTRNTPAKVAETSVPQPAYRQPEHESTKPAPMPVVSNASVSTGITTSEPIHQPASFDRPSYPSVTEPEPDPDDIPF